MERRTFLSLIAGTPAVAILAAACGSDSDGDDAAQDQPTLPAPVATDAPPATTAPGADSADADVLLEFGNYGGFTTANISFQMQPQVYVTTDNRVITPAATVAIYPGPLVSPSTVRTITPAGVEALLAAAEDAGLFADVEYERNDMVADAGTATLRINVDGTTYVHEAYALGIGGGPDSTPEDPATAALAGFIEQLQDLPSLVGAAELGPEEMYEPTGYQISTMPAGDLAGYEIEPTVVEWPADTGVELATLGECVEIDRDVIGDLFADATELTFFSEGESVYTVLARPALPGRDC